MDDDFPILAAVAASPTHSFEVLDHLQALGVRATRSTLYRRVDALIAEGKLSAEASRGPRGHARRTLGLTASGQETLSREAAVLLEQEPLESPYFSLAVSCARAIDTKALQAILRQRMATAARKLTTEERALNTSAAEDAWDLAARERRVAHLRADIAWLQSVLGRRLVIPGGRDKLPEAV